VAGIEPAASGDSGVQIVERDREFTARKHARVHLMIPLTYVVARLKILLTPARCAMSVWRWIWRA